MKDYCYDCEIENCELRNEVNFCEDCKDYWNCNIRHYSCCEAGEEIECNNGFEPADEYDEDEEYDEEFDDSWL